MAEVVAFPVTVGTVKVWFPVAVAVTVGFVTTGIVIVPLTGIDLVVPGTGGTTVTMVVSVVVVPGTGTTTVGTVGRVGTGGTHGAVTVTVTGS